MDLSSIIGIILGFGSIILGFLLEGGALGSLSPTNHPTPYIIVFGGMAGAVMTSFPMSSLKLIPTGFKTAFTNKEVNLVALINQLASISEKARKDGLLSLEQDAQTSDNDLIKKGLALIVDGIEADIIKDILERDSMFHENLHETTAKIFEAAGGLSPAMGVCGTVLGMIMILADMSDPDKLGPMISVAFLATFLGVGFANLFFLPIGGKIKAKAEQEKLTDDIVIEGLLSIQAGENPRIIKEKLNLTLIEKLSGIKPVEKAAAED
jgi:chemotaxis protein MotA